LHLVTEKINLIERVDDILTRQAEERPHAPAFSDTLGNAWTYRDLSAAANALGQTLLAGATIIPFNARQTAAEVDRIVDHATPAAILSTSDVSPDAAEHARRLGSTRIQGAFGQLDIADRASNPDSALDDVAVILYTTGTTGMPKGVMLTHGNLVFAGTASARLRRLRADDQVFGMLPISHVFGLASILIASTHVGAFVRLEPRFRVENLYAMLESGITILSAVPQMLAKLMQYAKEQGHKRLPVNTLRYLSSGAAPLDPDWKRRTEAFLGIPLQNGYGMTETTAGICLTDHQVSNPDDISVGKPFPGVEVALDHDASGGSVEVGEILVRGASVMKGYFRNPDATATALTPEGWLRTGDLGSWDAAGNLHIRGRSKELIIHGGFNVYPPEVEAALNHHPQVIQSAVIGHQLEGDEMVVAFIEAALDDQPNESELHTFAAKHLAPYKRPSNAVMLSSSV